jgi:GH24 family phage-related lysozyme (muramidase)
MSKKIDLSGFDEEISKDIDLSGFDEEISQTESTLAESMTNQSGIPDVGSIEEELLAGKYKDTAPSPVSAALRGAINEASFDMADELAAGAELGATKLSDLVTGTPSKYESLIKQYQDIRDVKRKGSKELEEAFPTESLAGRLTGAGVLAALSGGASIPASLAKQATKQGVKQAATQAAKLGAKYGAAQGVGKSEAEVLEGELGDLAGDISSEALLGGAAGGVIPTIVPAAKGAASTVKKGLEMIPGYESMKTGFELGKEGIVASAKTLGAEYKNIADDITKKIKTKLETAGVSKAQALELADQMQITMNAGADVQTAIEKASRSVGVDENQKRQYIEFLKRTMGEDVDLAKATQQLEQKRAVAIEKASREGKQLQTTTEINKDVGDVLIDPALQGRVVGFQDKLVKVGKDGKSTTSKLVTLKTLKDPDIPVTARDIENLTPSEMTEFLKDINQYTGNLDNKAANEVERNARQLASQINQKLNTALQATDVAALNNEMANLFNAIKNLRMPGNVTSKNRMVFDEQVAQVQKRLLDISDQGKVDKELIFKRLTEASPDFTTAEKRIQLLDEYKKIAEKGTGAGGFGLEALLGSAQRRATTAANIAGRASKAISEVNPSKVLREAGKALTESSPQSVQNLIAKVQANPKFQSFLPALQDAANATTDTARKVMLDNLNTQPAFREMMRSMDMGIQPTSPEESEAPMQENLQSSTPSSAQDLLEKFRSISNAIIPEAAAADSMQISPELQRVMEYENKKDNPGSGWDSSKNRWFPHRSLEADYPQNRDKIVPDTIAYGTLLDNRIDEATKARFREKGITDEEAKLLLTRRFQESANDVEDIIQDFDIQNLNSDQKTALTEMVYQLGAPKVRKFSNFLKSLSQGRWEDAEIDALDSAWAAQTPKRAIEVASRIVPRKK